MRRDDCDTCLHCTTDTGNVVYNRIVYSDPVLVYVLMNIYQRVWVGEIGECGMA